MTAARPYDLMLFGATGFTGQRVADSSDEAAVDALARQTRVLCTTAGPFWTHGRKLVRACARRGTDYCDITGEIPFVRQSVDDNHELALANRTRIVHACGFDSIPFDLGVHMIWDHSRRVLGEDLAWVKSFVTISGSGPRRS